MIHQAFAALFSSLHTALQVKHLKVLNFEILVEFLFPRISSSIEMVCLFSLIMSKKLVDQKKKPTLTLSLDFNSQAIVCFQLPSFD